MGSFHEITLKQVLRAERDPRIEVIELDPASFVTDALKHEGEVRRVSQKVSSVLETSKDVLIRTARSKDEVAMCLEHGRRKGLAPLETSSMIVEALGEIVTEVVKKAPLVGLFLCGGDTAYTICKMMNVDGLLLEETIAPGVVFSTLVGGPQEGTKVVTKGGSVGEEEAIVEVLNYLRLKVRTSSGKGKEDD